MGALGLNILHLKKVGNTGIIPAYLHDLQTELDKLAADNTAIRPYELFRKLLTPKPIQQFFAEFLRNDLVLVAVRHISTHNTLPFNVVRESLKADTYLEDIPPGKVREDKVLPLTREQAEQAYKAMGTPAIKETAAVLQSGIDAYFSKLNTILTSVYNVPTDNQLISRLSTGTASQSMWFEFVRYMAITNNTSPFAEAFDIARKQQAFETVRRGTGYTECPAQFLLKHLLNTDFVEQPDGTLHIAKNPRDGALPAFIYRKLMEQSQREFAPASFEAV